MLQVFRTEKGSKLDMNDLKTEISQSLQELSEQLEKLVKNAEEIRSEQFQEFRDKLSRKLLCLRPSVGGISAVSCCENTPQLGFSNISIHKLERILDEQLAPPKRRTPEKRLQSWLIQHALESAGRLKPIDDVLGGQNWFVSDEIALRTASNKKVVADMLTVRVDAQGLACLVNAELKSERQMETFRQVLRFRTALEHPGLQEGWKRFAEVMTGEQFRWNPSQETRGVVIWPALGKSPRKALADEKRKAYPRVDVIGYHQMPAYSLECEKAR